LKNKAALRKQIAADVGTSIRNIKIIINSLFCGAKLAKSTHTTIFGLIRHDAAVMDRLQKHEFIVGLRADIKKCWTAIQKPSVKSGWAEIDTGKCKSGKRKPLSPKAKWARYFQLERQVLDVVRGHLTQANIPHLLEHDGWVTKQELDLPALVELIKEKTGFSLTIEMEIL